MQAMLLPNLNPPLAGREGGKLTAPLYVGSRLENRSLPA